MRDQNPETTGLFKWVTAVESLVLIVAGGGLLFFPSVMVPLWPWELSPFNALLLGSIYSASLVATTLTVMYGRWSPARIVAPMILLFTTVVLVVSLAELGRFDLGHYSTWLWFVLYVGIPLNAAFYLWHERGRPPAVPDPLPDPWRAVILLPVAALGVYGVALLVAPDTFSSFWPWGIDAFHGRMYSVAFLTPALGAILVWKSAASREALTLGLTLVAGGIAPIVGLPLVNRGRDKVDWAGAGTWLWIASFAILVLAGAALVWRSRTQPGAHLD